MAFTSINLEGFNIIENQKRTAPTPKGVPFHLLILGNFSGDTARDNLGKPLTVDRDNFEEIMARLSPSLNLSALNESIEFTDLEHFEPDYLFQSLNVFSQLRSLKRRLTNSSTFADAAVEMNSWSTLENKIAEQTKPSSTDETAQPENILDALLSSTEQRQTSDSHSASDIGQQLIKNIIAPYIQPATSPLQPEYVKLADNAIADLMNNILHHPRFQALESLWRGLYFLMRRLTTDSQLKIFIVNISKQQLTETLGTEDPQASDFYRQLIEPYSAVHNATPWSVILGHFQFGAQIGDIQLLKRLSGYAAECNGCFVAEADTTLFGCDNNQSQWHDYETWNLELPEKTAQAWQDLRNSAASQHLALGYPRFLLRLPYGENTKAVEEFDFEEMPKPVHQNFLWSNGGLSISYLLAAAFSEYQWQFKPGQVNEIDDVPQFVYADEYGDKESYPAAEILLTEKGGEKLATAGVVPCWSVKNSHSVRVGPFVSAFAEPMLVQGKWLG